MFERGSWPFTLMPTPCATTEPRVAVRVGDHARAAGRRGRCSCARSTAGRGSPSRTRGSDSSAGGGAHLGVSAVTVTSWSRPPTSSVRSSTAGSPTASVTPRRTSGRKPGQLHAQLVGAHRQRGQHEVAVGLGECRAHEAGLQMPRRDLVAPSTTAREASRTTPVIAVVVDCAQSGAAMATARGGQRGPADREHSMGSCSSPSVPGPILEKMRVLVGGLHVRRRPSRRPPEARRYT